jgi:hypothetical protein
VSGLGSLAFQATHPSGGEGYVLVLSPPDAEGRVAYREFTPHAEPRDGVAGAAELRARVERWAREGWRFSEHVSNIERWLRARSG